MKNLKLPGLIQKLPIHGGFSRKTAKKQDSCRNLSHSSFLFTVMLILLITLPDNLFSFNGLTAAKGGHIDITRKALIQVFNPLFIILDDKPGDRVKISTFPVYNYEIYESEKTTPSDVLAVSSRLPDFYYFNHSFAHAQTPNLNTNKEYSDDELADIEINAVLEYLNFMSQLLKDFELLINKGQLSEALHIFGTYLHGFQDLFSHQGITNHIHRYYDKYLLNPDLNPDFIKLSEEYTVKLFKNLNVFTGTDTGSKLINIIENNEEVRLLSSKELDKLFNKNQDIHLGGIAYKLSSIPEKETALRYIETIVWDYKILANILITEKIIEYGNTANAEGRRKFLQKSGYDTKSGNSSF